MTDPNVSAYTILYDDDPDILNQGSPFHIQKYFNKSDGIVDDKINDRKKSPYSINSINVVTAIIFIISLLIIVYDFVTD
jgi:hypothetical protein